MAGRKLSSPRPKPLALICAYLLGIFVLVGTAAAGQSAFRESNRLEALMMLLAVESMKRREPQNLAQAQTEQPKAHSIPLHRHNNRRDEDRVRLMGIAALRPGQDVRLP